MIRVILLLMISLSANANPLDDATALVFEWLSPPAPRSDWPAFNSALQSVTSAAAAARSASESLEFSRDQLAYRRKQLATGAIEESELWAYAKSMIESRQVEERRRIEYVQVLHALSKRWGGERWWELRDLLVAYTGWHPDGCDIQAVHCL